ncbi:MAG: hypothetical protein ACK5KR_01370 [Breznakia sp.]
MISTFQYFISLFATCLTLIGIVITIKEVLRYVMLASMNNLNIDEVMQQKKFGNINAFLVQDMNVLIYISVCLLILTLVVCVWVLHKMNHTNYQLQEEYKYVFSNFILLSLVKRIFINKKKIRTTY